MTKRAKAELQVAPTTSVYLTWKQAAEYAKDYREGGHTDWRLPTIAEAKEIARTNPQPVWVWTSESRGSEAAYVGLSFGYSGFFDQGHSYDGRALPVRSCKSSEKPKRASTEPMPKPVLKLEIVQWKDRKGPNNIMVRVDQRNAQMLAVSLLQQILSDNPSTERAEFRADDGTYFSVAVHGRGYSADGARV